MPIRHIEFEKHKFEVRIESSNNPDGTTGGRIVFADVTKTRTQLGSATSTVSKGHDMMLLNGLFSFSPKRHGLDNKSGLILERRLLEAAGNIVHRRFNKITPDRIKGHVQNLSGMRSFNVEALLSRIEKVRKITTKMQKRKTEKKSVKKAPARRL